MQLLVPLLLPKKSAHITPVLQQLHWLRIIYRFQFKLFILVFKACHGSAPLYRSELIHPNVPTHTLRSSSGNLLAVMKFRLSAFQLLSSATNFLKTFVLSLHSKPLKLIQKLTYLQYVLLIDCLSASFFNSMLACITYLVHNMISVCFICFRAGPSLYGALSRFLFGGPSVPPVWLVIVKAWLFAHYKS